MNKDNVIEKLRDDEHYYGDFGKKYLSNSDISALLTNPLALGKLLGKNITQSHPRIIRVSPQSHPKGRLHITPKSLKHHPKSPKNHASVNQKPRKSH